MYYSLACPSDVEEQENIQEAIRLHEAGGTPAHKAGTAATVCSTTADG